MLQLSDFDKATPTELVALARLANDPEIAPPPHLRGDLEAKGWVKTSPAGHPLLTGRGRLLVERN
jgi:anti-sigma factor RsiW